MTCRPALSRCLKGASSLDDASWGRALSPNQRSWELSLLLVPRSPPTSPFFCPCGFHWVSHFIASQLTFLFLSFFLSFFTSDSNINMKEKKESEVSQSCLTLCSPMDCSPPGSSVHGILQARILEWVDISSPGDLPDPGIELRPPVLQADSLPSEPLGKPNIILI